MTIEERLEQQSEQRSRKRPLALVLICSFAANVVLCVMLVLSPGRTTISSLQWARLASLGLPNTKFFSSDNDTFYLRLGGREFSLVLTPDAPHPSHPSVAREVRKLHAFYDGLLLGYRAAWNTDYVLPAGLEDDDQRISWEIGWRHGHFLRNYFRHRLHRGK